MSEAAQAGRETVTSEEYYRMLWNHAVDAKVIVDAQGVIRDVNRRTEFKLGRTRAELIGTPVVNVFWDHDRARFRRVLTQAVTGGKERSTSGLHVPTLSGTVLTMDVEIVPVERTDGVMTVLLQFGDMTEKRQLEQQLIRSERLASLSQFASMFAHDIRNPLAGIKKTLELLRERPELHAQPIAQWFGDLQLTTDLLLGMINDMLDVYQESYSGLPIVVSHFPVGALFQEAVHLFKSEADAKGVTVRLDVCPDDITMTGDRRRLQRVGINLLHNALKYSPPKGVIIISIKAGQEGAMPVGLGRIGDEVLLVRVEDEGPGIDAEDLPSLFEMFFRKKDGHDLRIGRGLGLHFCRLVIEAHHGRIWAANRSTGGAQFSIAVPLNAQGST
ncbi:MAG: PAS domain-containing sensor histidine kinase [Nitrospirales bacterium]|nr:PAS domain-containing sensor histidine kinase [Nitrospirales bacterium]